MYPTHYRTPRTAAPRSGALGSAPRLVIGLTGNIACGKSTVVDMLGRLGAETIDADLLAHAVMRPDGGAYEQITRTFGRKILDARGEIDRRKLGDIVFADPTALHRLEAAVHPLVVAAVRERIAHAAGILVVDAIKLIESGLGEMCDTVWAVTCDPEQQLVRLMARSGLTREEALLRIQAQAPQEEKVAAADVVIDNSGSLEATEGQVIAAWEEAMKKAAAL